MIGKCACRGFPEQRLISKYSGFLSFLAVALAEHAFRHVSRYALQSLAATFSIALMISSALTIAFA